MPTSRRPLLLLPLLLAAAACREGHPAAFPVVPIPLSSEATNGCDGPNQAFAVAPVPVSLSTLVVGPSSQMVGSATAPELFVTGAGATIVRLDFSAGVGVAPTEDVLVDTFPQPPGVVAAPEPSGVAILDPQRLIVADLSSNALWYVDRFALNGVTHFAGAIDEAGGFSDGVGSGAAFRLDRPSALLTAGDGTILIADPGNHALRAVFPGTLPEVQTLAGFSGVAGSMDGNAFDAAFDAPTGLSLSCQGELLVLEEGGGRLRSVQLGPSGLGGLVTTLATGLGQPAGPASSSQGEVYWVDASAGAVERFDLASEALDSPVGGLSSSGGAFSTAVLRIGGVDHLFVLDAAGGGLFRLSP